jgi:NhaP-type Na+/H+ or K+/H+ antiporter
LLTFGALISATDPVSTLAVFQAKRVDPQLFYLVFGESVLNDAVGLVLFDAFSQFVENDTGAGKVAIGVGEFVVGFLWDAVGSPVLGILCGCGAALLFKCVDMRKSRLLELAVYVLIMYFPFLLAATMQLSGIVTILFCGMTARAYVVPNLSEVTAKNAETFFRLFAHLAETSIFLELGLSVFGLRGSVHGIFILWSLLACLIGRALNVYPISFLYNLRLQTEPKTDSELSAERRLQRKGANVINLEMSAGLATADHHQANQLDTRGEETENPVGMTRQDSNATTTSVTPHVRRDLKISANQQHMMAFSGLRGAVAYACVRSFPDTFGHQKEFIVTTMVIVLVTVFLFGGTTDFMLSWLKINIHVDEEQFMDDWHEERQSANFLLRLEDTIQCNVVRQDRTQSLQNVVHSPIASPVAVSSRSTEEQQFQSMEEERDETPPASRKRSSLYDFGKND